MADNGMACFAVLDDPGHKLLLVATNTSRFPLPGGGFSENCLIKGQGEDTIRKLLELAGCYNVMEGQIMEASVPNVRLHHRIGTVSPTEPKMCLRLKFGPDEYGYNGEQVKTTIAQLKMMPAKFVPLHKCTPVPQSSKADPANRMPETHIPKLIRPAATCQPVTKATTAARTNNATRESTNQEQVREEPKSGKMLDSTEADTPNCFPPTKIKSSTSEIDCNPKPSSYPLRNSAFTNFVTSNEVGGAPQEFDFGFSSAADDDPEDVFIFLNHPRRLRRRRGLTEINSTNGRRRSGDEGDSEDSGSSDYASDFEGFHADQEPRVRRQFHHLSLN